MVLLDRRGRSRCCAASRRRPSCARARRRRRAWRVYYVAGIAFAAVEAHAVSSGATFGAAVRALEPWSALVARAGRRRRAVGFAGVRARGLASDRARARAGRAALRRAPGVYAGRIPARVRRLSPAELAAYELPMGAARLPRRRLALRRLPVAGDDPALRGPALAWAVLPIAFTPVRRGAAASDRLEDRARLPAGRARSSRRRCSTARTGRRRLRSSARRRPAAGGAELPHARRIAAGAIVLVLVSLPFVPAVAGIGVGAACATR